MAFDPTTAVLVVDDGATAIRIVRKLLWQIGFINVDDASDGSSALTRMRAKRYGLVISDWNMAPLTGYEFLREVRADPTLARTPFIMVTADLRAAVHNISDLAPDDGFLNAFLVCRVLVRRIAAVAGVLGMAAGGENNRDRGCEQKPLCRHDTPPLRGGPHDCGPLILGRWRRRGGSSR